MEKIRMQIMYLLLALFCLPINSMAKSKNSFTVLQLNLWEAGSHISDGHQKIVDVLSEVNADVVFLCEIHGNKTVSKIVGDLEKRGVHYYGEAFDLNVAKFPLWSEGHIPCGVNIYLSKDVFTISPFATVSLGPTNTLCFNESLESPGK